MEKLIKYYSISNLNLRILSILFLIIPLIFIAWYSYLGSIIILFLVSYISTNELINNKAIITNVISGIISGFIAISPFIFYQIFNSSIYFENFIFYLITIIIMTNIFIPIIFNYQNIISNNYYKFIIPILLPSIFIIYGAMVLIENKNIFLLLIILSALNDSSAYAIGKIFGRHALSKKISPKKLLRDHWGGSL